MAMHETPVDLEMLAYELAIVLTCVAGPPALMLFIGVQRKTRGIGLILLTWILFIGSILAAFLATNFFLTSWMIFGGYPYFTRIEIEQMLPEMRGQMTSTIIATLVCGMALTIALKGKKRLLGIAYILVFAAAFYYFPNTVPITYPWLQSRQEAAQRVEQAQILASIEQKRSLWQAQEPSHNRYTVQVFCHSCYSYNADTKLYQGVTVEVLNGQPVQPALDGYVASYNTIEAILDRISAEVSEGNQVEVVYEPDFGYPQEITSRNHDPTITLDTFWITVEDFIVLEPETFLPLTPAPASPQD